jgi:drug/metabolite transporter (DMT)-like permease
MLGIILLGALVGPAVGVWLSMISIKHAPIGIASTLMALMPVTILPMTAIIHKERITYRAALGAVVACLGAAILFNSR